MTNMAGTEIFFKFPLITQEVVIKYFQKLFSIYSGSLKTLVTGLSDILDFLPERKTTNRLKREL